MVQKPFHFGYAELKKKLVKSTTVRDPENVAYKFVFNSHLKNLEILYTFKKKYVQVNI